MPEQVRCKFNCFEVTKRRHYNTEKGGFLYEAHFMAVTSNSEENKKFFDATPAGQLKIGTYAEDVFEVGKDYYLDLTLAEETGGG